MMTRKFLSWRLAAVLATVAACCTAPAQAAVHMADPFLSGTNPAAGEYTVGNLVGQNPTVSSFNAAWADGATTTTPGTFDAVAAGLSWPNFMNQAGGAVQFVNDGGFTNTQSAVRTFDNPNMAIDANYWLACTMSFDENFYASTNSSAFTGILNAEEPAPDYTVGIQWGFRGNATGGVDAVVRYRDNINKVHEVREYTLATNVTPGTHLFVSYIDSDWNAPTYGSEMNYIWFDPAVNNGVSAAGTPQLSTSNGTNWLDPDPLNPNRVVDTVVFNATDLGAGAVVKYDEVRLGDTWQEVVNPNSNVSTNRAVFVANPAPIDPTETPYDHAGTYYRESQPESIRGDHTVIQAGSALPTEPATTLRLRGQLSFSLDSIANGTEVASATLKMYVARVDETDGDVNQVDLYLADLPDNFDEMKASWNVVGSDELGLSIPWGPNGPGNPTSLLASVIDPTPETTEVVFGSTAAFVAAVENAINNDTPLDLAILLPLAIENSGLRQFIEFHSEDAADVYLHPVLTLIFDTGVSIPGDTNNDGEVNATDAQKLAGNWGITSATGPSDGDFNGDGKVNAADASILAANWGNHNQEGAAVPEPTTLALAAAAAIMLLVRRRTA